MNPSPVHQELLRKLPAVADLLKNDIVQSWLALHPRPLVTDVLRDTLAALRRQILSDQAGRCGSWHVTADYVLVAAQQLLQDRTRPHLRTALNATGIILHTGLGRAVLPESVVDSMQEEMKGYVTLAIDRESGERIERDPHVEYILSELTGAEAACVVNNNAGATLIVLAALAGQKEVIVSRGQLIEIGGSFRLPDVMTQSGTRLVEVGTTNRTHRKDYEKSVTPETAAILRVHPSNYRVMGFTAEVPLAELVEVAHARNLIMMDDLGAGALVDLAPYGLPHEPTVGESVAAGADVVLFSGDKLIGAGQCGIIVGKKALIEKIRKHPLYRALRVDKTCLMILERTLHLFRDPGKLAQTHPTYRMLATPMETLQERAKRLADSLIQLAPTVREGSESTPPGAMSAALSRHAENSEGIRNPVSSAAPDSSELLDVRLEESVGYLGSGSMPMEELPTWVVSLAHPKIKPTELAKRLRLDDHCVIARVENERVILDVRTLRDDQVPLVAEAVKRVGLA